MEDDDGTSTDDIDESSWIALPPTAATSSRAGELFHSVRSMSTRIWKEHFGQIGVIGSTSIAVNFLTGPAMLELPSLYQKAGIIPTTVTILIVGTLSALGSLHLSRVISQIPGNAHFEQPFQYSNVFEHYFLPVPSTTIPSTNTNDNKYSQSARRFLIRATQVAFFACISSLTISSMVESAQVMDSILANPHFVGQTVGLEVGGGWWRPGGMNHSPALSSSPHDDNGPRPSSFSRLIQLTFWNYLSCHAQQTVEGDCIPFTDYNPDEDMEDDYYHYGDDTMTTSHGFILSLGYLLTVLCFLPLSLMDLQENAAWQVVEFIVLLVTAVVFAIFFIGTINTTTTTTAVWSMEHVSWWGESWDGLLGVILFNFALVISISSWLYEKEPGVDARQVIVGSTSLAALLYITLGILGAMAIPQVSPNMLESFLSGTYGPTMQYNASFFALFIIGLGIPLLCVLCRLNLQGGDDSTSRHGGGGMSERTANWLAVYLPFGISWMFYKGDSVTQLLSWGGTICTSLIAFVFPWLVALQALNVTTTSTTTIAGGPDLGDASIDVYGKWWRSKLFFGSSSSRERERTILLILLSVSMLCIAFAILGNLLQYESVDESTP